MCVCVCAPGRRAVCARTIIFISCLLVRARLLLFAEPTASRLSTLEVKQDEFLHGDSLFGSVEFSVPGERDSIKDTRVVPWQGSVRRSPGSGFRPLENLVGWPGSGRRGPAPSRRAAASGSRWTGAGASRRRRCHRHLPDPKPAPSRPASRGAAFRTFSSSPPAGRDSQSWEPREGEGLKRTRLPSTPSSKATAERAASPRSRPPGGLVRRLPGRAGRTAKGYGLHGPYPAAW